MNDLDGFPELKTEESYSPALVAFLFEDVCAVCGKGDTDATVCTWRMRLHKEVSQFPVIQRKDRQLKSSESIIGVPKWVRNFSST